MNNLEKNVFGQKAENSQEELSRKLENVLQKKQEKKSSPSHEAINDLVEGLPDILKEKIIADIKRLEGYGLNEEQLRIEAEIRAREIRENYLDKRFDMPNKSFAKLETMQTIDNILEGEVVLEDLKKTARVSFDLNGLKSVNDITRSHENGDRYLKLFADILKKEELAVWLKERNIEAVATADGGDEFGAILKSDKEISSDVLNEFMDKVENELSQDERASEILDFSDEKIILAFAGISEEDLAGKTAEERRKILEEAKKEIPADYKFKAIVSSGAATLYDSFADVKISGEDDYERILGKMMGSIFDKSDENMQKAKVDFKRGLRDSNDPEKIFLAKVYSRSEGEVEARRLLEEYMVRFGKL